MAVIVTNLACDLQEAVKIQYLKGNLFSADNQANRIDVSVYEGGEPASISGTVTANIIRADGGTVTATGGTISGNVASITMPAAAYAVPGVVSIIVKLTAESVVTTLAAVVANVYQSSTETAVDPGTIIPSVTALIAEIEAAQATIPAGYNVMWTTFAPAFSSSASYTPGQYVTYDGALYVCTTAHTGSWVAGHFAATNVGTGLSDLKSATNNIIKQELTETFTASGNMWFPFSFVAGKTYIFKNTSSGNYGEVAHTVDAANSYDYIEQIGTGTILQNGSVTFVPQSDAPYLVVYCNGAGTFSIECIDTIKVLENDISANKTNITNLVTTVANNKTEAEKNTDALFSQTGGETYASASYKWLQFIIKKGHTYRITNTGSKNITAANTTSASGSYTFIESIGTVNAYQVRDFTANYDASYVAVYMAGEGSYTIEEITTISKNNSVLNDLLENNASEHMTITNALLNIPAGAEKVKIGLMWESGRLNVSTGAEEADAFSIRSYKLNCNADMGINVTAANSNNSVVVFEYNGSTFTQALSVTTSGRVIPCKAGYIYRVYVYGNSTYPTNPGEAETYVTIEYINPLFDGIPAYYNSYLPSKISEIETASAYIQGVTFPFITDVHLPFNTLHSAALIKYIGEKTNAVPFVLFGGDVPKAIDTADNVLASAKQWTEYIGVWGREKTIQVHGNHDYMCALDNTLTNLWFAPLSKCFEYIQQNDYFLTKHPVGALYGCVDIPNQKVKIIYADNYDDSYDISDDSWTGGVGMSNSQLKWIASEVLNNSTGYSVLFVSHVPTLASLSIASEAQALKPYDDLIKAAHGKSSYTVDGETFDFSNWDGTVIGELAGHMHKDGSGTSDGVLYVGTTCDAYLDDDETTRTVGTTSEQAFDIVCIDTLNKTIKTVRIGGGESRSFNY